MSASSVSTEKKKTKKALMTQKYVNVKLFIEMLHFLFVKVSLLER